nr:M15 family metallopeptidase [Pseudoclavibacter sp. 13-3]
MRRDAAAALHDMDAAAQRELGQGIQILSGFRSYQRQQALYGAYERRDGQAAADRYSSRPGHSEHQTGLACDIAETQPPCELCNEFAQSGLGTWLQQNSWRFGFVQRYETGQEQTTGYMEEAWHYRYVGVPLASWMRQHDVHTLEKVFGLPDAPDYTNP